MPHFLSSGKPNSPPTCRCLGGWPDKIASNYSLYDFDSSVYMTLIVLRNTIFKMINIWQHHVWTDMHKRLASVHSILGRGSLIPLPTIDVGETSQIKQQAFRVSMTFMVLRTTIFKMKDSWRLHTKKDMHKRLASVHSKVGRGSLIPQPSIDVRGADQIKKQAIRVWIWHQ